MEVDSAVIVPPPLSLSSHAREQFSDIATKLDLQLKLADNPVADDERNPQPGDEIEEEDEEGEEDGDYEFSFACAEASSPISAEDLFEQGQIKPIFPWEGNDAATEPLKVGEEARLASIPVKKVFVERRDLPAAYKSVEAEDIDRVAEGPYCAWSKGTESAGDSTSTAPETCRKSNSTGFSKLRRFRDLLHRSQSDGKDTFVFLTPEKTEKQEETTSSSSFSSKKDKKKKKSSISTGKREDTAGESKTTSSRKSSATKTSSSLASYALQYGGKGKEKRRSYLPYRQDLVGFFTNSNSMSKNIHPY